MAKYGSLNNLEMKLKSSKRSVKLSLSLVSEYVLVSLTEEVWEIALSIGPEVT